MPKRIYRTKSLGETNHLLKRRRLIRSIRRGLGLRSRLDVMRHLGGLLARHQHQPAQRDAKAGLVVACHTSAEARGPRDGRGRLCAAAHVFQSKPVSLSILLTIVCSEVACRSAGSASGARPAWAHVAARSVLVRKRGSSRGEDSSSQPARTDRRERARAALEGRRRRARYHVDHSAPGSLRWAYWRVCWARRPPRDLARRPKRGKASASGVAPRSSDRLVMTAREA